VLMMSVLNGVCFAQSPVPDAKMHEEVVMIPEGSGLFGVKLETTIFKPPGNGPFPILIMNHGKSAGIPHFQGRSRFLTITRVFINLGYAIVLPMRKGFSESTGIYVGGGCNIAGNGRAQAEDLVAALDYVVKQPWADKDRMVVAGQSQGGLATIALGELNYPGVKGLINFAGGLTVSDCQWKTPLVDAFGKFGGRTKVSSIWFYGENDSYFSPEVVKNMYAAYTAAGGREKLVAYGPFQQDSHTMSGSIDGVGIWWPETKSFLESIGMPTESIQSPPK
jgi:dienelactone hydrolase